MEIGGLPDPNWYVENVLAYAEPGVPAAFGALSTTERWRRWWAAQARGDDAAVRLARAQGFVVTTAQLRELGWRRHDDRREQRRGHWSPAGSGARTPVNPAADDLLLARRRRHALAATASALGRRDHAISGRSAAILHGLPTLSVPARPELTGADTALGRRDRAHVFGAVLAEEEITTWYGTRVTTVARTVTDAARHDRRDGLMAADAALHEKLLTREDLQRALARARGWPGVSRARATIALANPRAESPLESLVRLRLHEDHFPEPALQVVIPDPRRGRSYRVDLLLRAERLVIEADGAGKYTPAESLREKRRETRLRALGYRVERVMWDDVMAHWEETSARLRSLLLTR